MAAPPPPPELNPDAVAEILVLLPPDEPSDLVCASAVCKTWFRTVTDPGFLRRYRAFHGTPRVSGFLHNPTDLSLERFVPTTAFRPPAAASASAAAAAAAHRTCVVLDCRHGRALLYDYGSTEFVVWDPVTRHERRIPDEFPDIYTNHAVLCAAGAGCDHSTCSRGPFLLACAGVHSGLFQGDAYACFYSSETGARSARSHLRLEHDHSGLDDRPASFVGGALYFAGYSGDLLRYDVLGGRGRLSVVELPANLIGRSTIVMTAGNGELGLAKFGNGMLALWSIETGPDRDDAIWVRTKLIDLQELLPFDISTSAAWLSGFAEEGNAIFLSTDDNGVFTIELESLLTTKVYEMGNVNHVFPYLSCLYTPVYTPVGLKLLGNYSSSEGKLHHWESDVSSSKDNMPGSPRMMDDEPCDEDEEEADDESPTKIERMTDEREEADDEPPTKRQKRILSGREKFD